MKRFLAPLLLVGLLAACDEDTGNNQAYLDSLTPDWTAIDAWPGEGGNADLSINPDRTTTIVVFDDSGSMGSGIEPAKQAILGTIADMPNTDRVGFIALNAGVLLDVVDAAEAKTTIAPALNPVRADGGTPLGQRVAQASDMLAADAARQRGFGRYRILVVTDGAASDGNVLLSALQSVLSTTPIQVATIGIGVGEGHVLNLPGYTTYVDVSRPEDLGTALAQMAAEDTSFQALTSFD